MNEAQPLANCASSFIFHGLLFSHLLHHLLQLNAVLISVLQIAWTPLYTQVLYMLGNHRSRLKAVKRFVLTYNDPTLLTLCPFWCGSTFFFFSPTVLTPTRWLRWLSMAEVISACCIAEIAICACCRVGFAFDFYESNNLGNRFSPKCKQCNVQQLRLPYCSWHHMLSEKSAYLVISYSEYDLIWVNISMYPYGKFFSVTVAKVSQCHHGCMTFHTVSHDDCMSSFVYISYCGLVNKVLSY